MAYYTSTQYLICPNKKEEKLRFFLYPWDRKHEDMKVICLDNAER